MIARQLESISDYVIKYLGDKGNDEILIERRLYSKLKEALRQISFTYYEVISDKISSLIRDIYRENIIRIFVEAEKKLKFTRI